MKKKVSSGLQRGIVAIAGSLFLASCSSPPPSQTTIIVKAPVAPEPKGDVEKDDIADSRNSDDDSQVKSSVKSVNSNDRNAEVPVAANTAASTRHAESQLLDFYDRLDSKHFAAFGSANRRSLLKRKGAIVDYKHNFIQIPGSADPSNGDLRLLQITLFPNGDEPWCAVSRIVWPQGHTPGTLDFYYGEADDFDRHPRTAAESFFPYNALGKNDEGYLSAYLPRQGLEIFTSSNANSDFPNEVFRYNRHYKVGEPGFIKVTPTGNY